MLMLSTFTILRTLLRREGLPEDTLTKEHDLRECLVVMSSAGYKADLSLVSETLKWFPRLAQHTAIYLRFIVQTDADSARKLITEWLNPISTQIGLRHGSVMSRNRIPS